MKISPLQKRIKNFKAGDEQIYVEAYPKGTKHDRSDIDVLRLTVKSIDHLEPKVIDMTPDEAIELANTLVTASMFWLMNYKPYWDTFMARKRSLDRNLKRRERRKNRSSRNLRKQ